MVDAGHCRLGRFEQHRFAENRSSVGVGLQPPTVQPLGSSGSQPSLRSFRVEPTCRPNERAALIASLLLALAMLSVATPLYAETLIGRANHVRDGDTIVVNRTPIRLERVAAPELDDKWGRASKDAMQRIVAGQRLRCELRGAQTHDREVGVCYLDDGTDIGAEIISLGLARDCPRFSGGRYASHEVEKSRNLPEVAGV